MFEEHVMTQPSSRDSSQLSSSIRLSEQKPDFSSLDLQKLLSGFAGKSAPNRRQVPELKGLKDRQSGLRARTLLGAPGIATRSKDAISSSWPFTRNKKLLVMEEGWKPRGSWSKEGVEGHCSYRVEPVNLKKPDER